MTERKKKMVKLLSLNTSPLNKHTTSPSLERPSYASDNILRKVMLLQNLHTKRSCNRNIQARSSDSNNKSKFTENVRFRLRVSPRKSSSKEDEQKAKDFDDLMNKYNSIFSEELKFAGINTKLSELFTLPKVKNIRNKLKSDTAGKLKMGISMTTRHNRSQSQKHGILLSQSNKTLYKVRGKEVKVIIAPKTMLPLLAKREQETKIGCLTDHYRSRKQPLHIQELSIEDQKPKGLKLSALELLNYIVQQPPPRFKA